MKKLFVIGISVVISLAMLVTSCKKDKTNNQDYPSTAEVIENAVTDIDGNSYDAVQIGDQVWMAKNLRTTRFANGASIPMGDASGASFPCRYAPNGNEDNVAQYGYLYNWHTATRGESNKGTGYIQGICPDGWHLPSSAEFSQLISTVNNSAKAIATTWGWMSSNVANSVGKNPNENNSTGFSAPPAGSYEVDNIADSWYNDFGQEASFWSHSVFVDNNDLDDQDAYHINIDYDEANIELEHSDVYDALSVRCIRDN